MTTKVNVEQWVTSWINLRAGALAPRTVESYQSLLRLHIAPALGALALDALLDAHVLDLLSGLCAAGRTRTAQLCHILLRAALRDAVLCGRLPASPLARVPPPRHVRANPRWWTADQLRRFLEANAGSPWLIAWQLALCCGLRRGELAGLRWSDVDVEAGVLRVRNQRQRLIGRGIVDMPPKSASGSRVIALPDGLAALLSLHFLSYGGRNAVYVLSGPGGMGFDPAALNRAFKAALRAAGGLPPITLHGLRHTMATLAVTCNVSMRVLQGVLGHANFATTAAVYAHVIPDAQRAALDTIAAHVLY